MIELGYAVTVIVSVLVGAWINYRASNGRSPFPSITPQGRVESEPEHEPTKRRSKM